MTTLLSVLMDTLRSGYPWNRPTLDRVRTRTLLICFASVWGLGSVIPSIWGQTALATDTLRLK